MTVGVALRWLGVVACAWLWGASTALAQSASPQPDEAAAGGGPRARAIAAADIPARADADEKLVRTLERRARESDTVRHHAAALAQQAAALNRLSDFTDNTDLSTLSVQRLESLERHWRLHGRAIDLTRADLARATNTTSEDAADLARRRASWTNTLAEPDLSQALQQRARELVDLTTRAQDQLAGSLATMLDFGRRSSALSAQVQEALSDVVAQVEALDRQLVVMDAPLLWQMTPDAGRQESIGEAVRRSLQIETAFARDYDAARARLLPALAAIGLLLLPMMFWIKRRAGRLVAAGDLNEAAAQALARPWAAWLLLLAGAAVLYDLQGPNLRQQLVMLLAWIPLLGLLRRRLLSIVGPWAYLSAVFYLLNVVVSMLVGNLWLYRVLLLALTLVMLLTLAWHAQRAREAADDADDDLLPARMWSALRWIAIAVMVVAAGANVLGNVSLASVLVSATLDSSYAALAIYAGAKVLLALLQVLLAGPTVSRFASRHAGAVVPAVLAAGRALLVIAWLIFTLQAFRVYRPTSTLLVAVLTHEFQLGSLSLSLGNLVTFAIATWAAFWLARTIRVVLAESVLASLPLPRGVGSSIASLSYYGVLFLGLLAALAASGFHVGQLTLVFGALGVGIGIGLQDVVRNFVSGLILMFERPIQRGDTVEVSGMVGRVREVGLRATTVTTFDGADVVVPNGMLLADKLVNWTLSGTSRRITLEFNIVYTADPRRVIELLVRIARAVDGVSAVPAPAAIVTGLANGVLEFSLRAWTIDHADWVQVRSELAMRTRDALADAGIEVPLPQRDLLVRMVPSDVARMSGPSTSGGHRATQEATGADPQHATARGQPDLTDRRVDFGNGRTSEPGQATPTER